MDGKQMVGRPQSLWRGTGLNAIRTTSESAPATSITPVHAAKRRALVLDLNNFANFPTLAVGILIGSLRNSGSEVELISPLAHDVPATERERREWLGDHLARRIHLSTWAPFRGVRNAARRMRAWWINRPQPRVLREAAAALDRKPDVVLLSAYLQHYPTVVEIGKLAEVRAIPLILGGPVFNMSETADAWRKVPGLAAIVGGEADLMFPDLIETACARGDLLAFDGVTLPDGRRSSTAPPLRALDRVPVPDFTDFPWHRYRVPVIPVMAGRGCQWNRCLFCSDVVSVSGRTFRTRSLGSVLSEMREQARRHATRNFIFLDLKLNSSPAMFRGIVENVQRYIPGAQWIGTVHVDLRRDNGLTRSELFAAAAAGMRRISFGLESGSQRLLDAMHKGASVEANAEFIRNAHAAGLSIRCTMFKGFPGETAEDLECTARFLEEHEPYLDRVRFNEFSIVEDTPIYSEIRDHPWKYPAIRVLHWDHRNGRARYVNTESGSGSYRKAKARVLRVVHAINRRPVRSSADTFDGLM
jgi:anaerobic magnesium-protoporphyrin IX monomethyl ester cyclase